MKGDTDIVYFHGNYWNGDIWPNHDERIRDHNPFKELNDEFVNETVIQVASFALLQVEQHAGCSVPMRDDTDNLFIAEHQAVNGTPAGNASFDVIHEVADNNPNTPFSPGAGGNPAAADTENGGIGDGMADAWEMQHFGTLDRQPWENSDTDGWTNLEEYLNSTDPLNADDPYSRSFSF